MATRKANAVWEGGAQSGQGKVSLGSGAFEGNYSFKSRFEDGSGTNPEELVGAAHAGCYSMALSVALEQAGHSPERISTEAQVNLKKEGEGFTIDKIKLVTEAKVPDLSEEDFQQHAKTAKENCPVSKALAGVDISLDAKLVS